MASGLVGATALAVVTRGRAARELRAVEGAWGEWARRRGFAFEPPPGGAWSLTAPRVWGVVDGVSVSLDGMVLDPHDAVAPSASRRERGRMPHTSLAARALSAYPGAMVVMSRARLDASAPSPGYRQMDLADARFDEACALYAGPWSPAHRLADRAARAALVHLAQRPFVLFANGPSLWVRWPGYERDAAMLDHAVTALVRLSRDAG